jgi:hypothetical protein
MNHLSEEELILHYYGEEGEPLACEQHLESCEGCRSAYGSLQRVLNVVNSMPVPERGPEYGAQLWRRIEKQVPARRRFQWLFSPGSFSPGRLAVAGAFAALLVASFLAGQFYSHTPGSQSPKVVEMAKTQPGGAKTQPGGEQQVRERILLVAVGDYLERSHMMLIELVNANAKGPIDITSAQERAEDLLTENRLYRQTADHTGDTAVSTVLDELDRVLLDIAHSPSKLSPGDLEQFRQRLKAEGILFKIRVLGSNVRNQEEAGPPSPAQAPGHKL